MLNYYDYVLLFIYFKSAFYHYMYHFHGPSLIFHCLCREADDFFYDGDIRNITKQSKKDINSLSSTRLGAFLPIDIKFL